MTEHNDRDLERVERVEKMLDDLEREDAPEHLVQKTLARVREEHSATPLVDRSRERRWAGGLAAAVVAFAAVGIVYQQLPTYQDVMVTAEPDFQATERDVLAPFKQALGGKDTSESASGEAREADLPARSVEIGAEDRIELFGVGEVRGAGGRLEAELAPANVSAPAPASTAIPGGFSDLPEEAQTTIRQKGKQDAGGRYREQPRYSNQYNARGDQLADVGSISEILVATESTNRDPGAFFYEKSEAKKHSPRADGLAKISRDLDLARNESRPNTEPEPEPEPVDKLADESRPFKEGALSYTLPVNTRRAEHFLARYQNLDGLSFQQPTGYWANNYVPGDPAMRRLEAQLRAQHPQALTTTLERNAQPFDAPENAALGAYLHATRSAVDGPTRLQLQVGLQAAERQGGLRPPMNVAIVLDLPATVDVTVAQQTRALLMAMNEQRQTGDRFSVTVAGVPGGTVVQPDDYRHGTVLSFIERLANGQLEGDTLDLVDSLVAAVDRLAADDDPSAVLGSSLVLLVSADGIDAQTRDGLETLAHSSAVAGMPVSVVTLGGADGSGLESIALAGQGRLRALVTAADAAQLIDRELHSASRTVARAVRLRIQLKPGVKLVEVVGSYRLDEAHAQRVREAEQSIDARLSRTWGIQADRGDDENGIQIVIPGLAAGEHHVVLLDVVVDGPGAVADLQVRYKDLVQMNNGVVRTSLSLNDASTTRHAQGPLERNVIKNLLAMEISAAARRSAHSLANGDVGAAHIELTDTLTLISGLRHSVPGWESDPELQADEQHLNRFLRELNAGYTDLLTTELEYAAYRKLLPAAFSVAEQR